MVADAVERMEVSVRGRVQGVSFRYATRNKAERLGVTGWVKNEADGSVTIVAEGKKSRLEELLVFLKIGPRLAEVEAVDIAWQQPTDEFALFSIRWV